MTQQTQSPKSPDVTIHKRKTEPPWLWLMLVAGSAVIHTTLAIVAVPWLGRMSRPPQTFSPVAIDLIDLPPEAASSAAENESGLTSIAAPPQASASPNTPAFKQSAIASPAAPSKRPQSAVPAPPVSPPIMNSRVSPPAANPPDQTENQPGSTAPSSANAEEAASSGTVQPNQATVETEPGTGIASPASRPSPTAVETPGFATIPIDLPTPDVSETLPIRPTPAPASPLAQVEVNRENTPVNLTVSLDFERISVEKAGDDPDQLAAPMGGVDSQEISTVDESACAGALKPEVMQSLGVKVGLQVSTDATGQVTQTAAQAPSRNPAYNELARCLVQHWEFAPAQEDGEPVPSDALLVWVTIDRT